MSSSYLHVLSASWRQSTVALAAWLLFSGVVAAQDLPATTARPELSLPASPGVPLRVTFPPVPGVNAKNAMPPAGGLGGQSYNGGPASTPNPGDAPAGVRRITLEEAQQMAAGASNPLARLAELQVEVAKQHRLGVQGLTSRILARSLKTFISTSKRARCLRCAARSRGAL